MSRRIQIILVILFAAVLLGMGGYAGWQLYLSHRAYEEGDQAYAGFASQIVHDSGADSEEETSADTPEDPAARTIDFDALEALNPDAIGWLYSPGTPIDYPVMGAEDYNEYLRTLPDGTYNINGSLFLDYRCPSDFSGKVSVIYGHHMKTGKMFGTLVEYKNQTYFDEHPYLYLYTRAQTYRIALVCGAVIGADQWIGADYVQDPEGLMEFARSSTTFTSPVDYTGAEQLVVLSTCSYEFENARYILVGLLQPEE